MGGVWRCLCTSISQWLTENGARTFPFSVPSLTLLALLTYFSVPLFPCLVTRHRCVVALIANKANPNVLDFMDYSVLHYACMLGWRDTAEFLLTKGADPRQLNVLGQNCLMLAIKVSFDTPM